LIRKTKNPAEAGFFAVLVAQAAGLAAAFLAACFLTAFLAGVSFFASVLAAGAAAGAEAAWAKAPMENAEAIRTAMIFFMMNIPAGNLDFEPIAQVSQRGRSQAG
jgi:hypothetical protein